MSGTLITGGTIIDCTGAKPKKNAALFVENGRIAKIGATEAVRAHAAKRGRHKTIDANGLTMMPGLVDAHCHVSYGDILSVEELDLYAGVEFRAIRAAHNVRKVLRAGVTAICDPGSTWNVSVAVRDAINCGMIEGPRMASAGRYITTFNAIGSFWPTWMEHPQSSFAVLCNTRDEMITEVRREVKEGVDIVKVAGDGDAVQSHARESESSLSPDDLRAIAETTHRLGRRCTIHARTGVVAAAAAEAGFDWLIHASYLNDDQLATILRTRTPINPTLSLLANAVDWAPELGAPSGLIESYKRELEAASRGLSKAHKEGILIMAGTDSGQGAVPYGEWHARELEHLMHYLGLSAMDALKAGTINAAFATGMQNEIGTLEEGKFADLLVVDGDPLVDIQVLQDKARLKVIMKGGVVIDTETPIPERTIYPWEKPMLYWNDPRLPGQDYVREHASNKPAWMKKVRRAAE
ncbi:MAG: amidohydrolase family protein [Alphaproteobacteria bacterium]|nr:amidohydrolase family protein [Alphaproteobacteria bacterium]